MGLLNTLDLKIVLPHCLFKEVDEVTRVVVESQDGSFGILPNRRDCTAILVPGILIYETKDGENFIALDHGVLVKAGKDVTVSVHSAFGESRLGNLKQVTRRRLDELNEKEQGVRSLLAKLEVDFVRRYLELRHHG